MLLSELWGDSAVARRMRMGVGALIVVAVLVGSSAPSSSAGRVAFAASLAVAAVAWAVWALAPAQVDRTFALLLAIGVAGAVAFGATKDAWAALAFSVVAVAAAAERLPLHRALGVAATVAAALFAVALVDGSWLIAAIAVLVPCAGFVAGLAPRHYVERAEQAELLLAESQRAREEAARAAALDERVRLARELHDVLAHSLAALTIQLEVAHVLLAENRDADGALAQIERSQTLVAQGMAETRDAVAALRGESEPLPALLARLIDDYKADSEGAAELDVVGEPRELAPEAMLACRRIAQEAITNVRKHAPGADVHATLTYGPRSTSLTIRNTNGHSPSPAHYPASGWGIDGMRERAELLRGTLTSARADDGWELELQLPA